MKTIIKKAVMLSVVVLLAAVFCSCGKDEPKIPEKTTYTVNCEVTGNLLSIATLHVIYTDSEGEVEVVSTDGKLNFEVEYTTYPFTTKPQYYFVLKEDAKIEEHEEYEMELNAKYSFVTKYNTGRDYTYSNIFYTAAKKLVGTRLEDFFKKTPTSFASRTVGIDGKVEEIF